MMAAIRMMVRNVCGLCRSIPLKLAKRQVLTIRNAVAMISAPQMSDVHHCVTGSPPAKCTTAAITAAPPGMGIPTKYFFPGLPGFEGCGFFAMLNRVSRLAPAVRNMKRATNPNWPIYLAGSWLSLLTQCYGSTRLDDGKQRQPHVHATVGG